MMRSAYYAELLNEALFFNLDNARAKFAAWVADFNTVRPHSALEYLTPAAYAANFTAPHSVKSTDALNASG